MTHPAGYLPPRPTCDQRIVAPGEGDRFTFIGRSGEPRYYEVVSAEFSVSWAAIVHLKNIDNGRSAWVTKRWMTFPQANGRWLAGWVGREEAAA